MLSNKIVHCVRNLPSSFKKQELAFLALTGKPELHLRDSLAFNLQSNLSGYLVCREWQRHDIVIFREGSGDVRAVIEVKVYYTFDGVAPNKRKGMEEALRVDVRKMRQLWPKTEKIALLFLIHPQSSVPEMPGGSIAYAKEINQVYRKSIYGGPEQVLKTAKKNVGKFWQKEHAVWTRQTNYTAGQYRGIHIQIPSWVVKV